MGPGSVLKSLTIQDLAVVRHLDLEFHDGLTVITGETGAGKSIVVDALGLLLGDRADSTLVRSDAERAVLSALFDISERPSVAALLASHELNGTQECLLRRVIGHDGRSRAFCNETPITLQILREIGTQLVDIHGQHEHHSLLQRAVQRSLIDEFGKLGADTAKVAEAYAEWHAAERELRALRGADETGNRADYLRFQLEELGGAQLETHELLHLETEHRRAAHAQRLNDGCAETATRMFHGERAAARIISTAAQQIKELAALDPNLNSAQELLEQAAINLTEVERELAHYRERLLTQNPRELEQLEQRLRTVHDLCRKHRCELASLPDVLLRLREELATLDTREERCAVLEAEILAARQRYTAVAATLSQARRNCGEKMATEITRILRQLGMPHAVFAVEQQALPSPSAHGSDEVEFMVTTNPDVPPRPLRKVASGGELSRASLAIQVATASSAQVPTLIYDEIDTGIGGRVATTVAQHLQTIAHGRQVLCVTHLAQVASAGTHHLSITKHAEQGITLTQAQYLEPRARVEEIARMLGGAETTARARAHARELLAG
jgi:DNA repair protein RecN (Recombination protein N)